MKLQSSIEFLTTYSFLFLLIGIILSFLFFFSSAPRSVIPGQCISSGGVSCASVEDYVNMTKHYSLFTFSFTNAQAVPINVLSMTVFINTANSIASGCIPSVEYPGGTFTCVAAMTQTPSVGSIVNGYYTVNTLYCNSGISSLQNNCTSGSAIQYSGSFSTTASSTKPLLFSVLTLLGPQNQQLPPFETNPQAIPSGYTRVQNGGWSTVTSSYGFGSQAYQGNNFIGVQVSPFTLSTSALGNNAVSCSGSYNSLLSMAYTIIYLPPPTTGTGGVSIYTNNAIEFYYAASNLGWSNLFGGNAWHSNLGVRTFSSNSISLSSGINYLAILWSHDCGPGVQVINVAGLPGTASTTSSTSTTSTSTTSTSTTSSTSTSTTSTSTTSTIAYIFCGAASSTATYSVPILGPVLGAWSTTNSLPTLPSGLLSCNTNSGYIYCIGGHMGTNGANYYASISTNIIGAWKAGTAYPYDEGGGPCTVSANFVTCVAGYVGSGSGPSSTVYSAPISSSGTGTWVSETAYPTAGPYTSCVSANSRIYCVGGTSSASTTTYYATLNSGTVGTWTSTNSYPVATYVTPCTTDGSRIYCVGGNIAGAQSTLSYYATVSTGGIGTWSTTTAFPVTTEGQNTCVTNNGYIYCVSDTSSSVYYAPISSGGIGTWVATNSFPTTAAATCGID